MRGRSYFDRRLDEITARAIAASLASIGAALLTACGSTPGLTVRCDGHCHVTPADLHARRAPGDGHPFPAR